MFRKILIANRGEIALVVLRACWTLGIEAVVVYSEAGEQAAGPACRRGDLHRPRRRASLYLSAPAVISAASVTDCDAIHPRYGFLSEDEGFGTQAAHGLTFIGPPADVLERFGSKEVTRRLLGSHGLPTIPGSTACSATTCMRSARRNGSATRSSSVAGAGGGGKGMRMLRTARD